MAQHRRAGDGVTDDEFVEQVARQTDSEHQQRDFFERETDGAVSDTDAASTDADEAAAQ